MKSNLLGGKNSKRHLRKLNITCLRPPVLKAPRRGVLFKFYIAAEDKVIRAILTQETEEKEYVVTFIGRRLIDTETRYTFIEKLCLSLYHACTKL